MTSRRQFISLLGGAAAAWPVAAWGQPGDRVRRVGILMHATENDQVTVIGLAAFKKALGELGWVDARNLQIDYRYSDGNTERLSAFARELVALQPDVLFSRGTPPTMALLKETRIIPIVFVAASDPLGSGFVSSLARPDGNVTGFSNFEQTMAGKWLELLKEVAPDVVRVAVIFNPATAVDGGRYFLRPIEDAARSVRVATSTKPIHTVDEIAGAVAAFASEPGGGLIVIPDLFNSLHRGQIIAHATRHRLPAVFSSRQYIRSGGLIAYGVDSADLFRRAATYIDRIFHGVKPADLPVQQPTKFELIVNLKSAKAIGLTIPESFLVRADEVIE